MITINPVKFSTSKQYISFGDGNNVTKNMAILALQNPNARREFEGNLNNSMPSNPISSVIKKIARTYKYVVSSSEQPVTQAKNPDQHITFLG
ncbi:hypothetical protein IKP85_02940 [bacterium]|nr:hypothetical protein [bacterium]